MAYTLSLGAAPSQERSAKLGRTIGFAAINAFEVQIYRVAMIAYYGPPPPGCALVPERTQTSAGPTMALTLRVDDDADDTALDYARKVAAGLTTWADAGFQRPVSYKYLLPLIPVRDEVQLILLALLATNPQTTTNGERDVAMRIHANLTAAFPGIARIADETKDRSG